MLLAGVIGALTLYMLWRLALYLREPPPTTEEYIDIARSVAFAFAALGVLPAGYIAYVRQRTHDWQLREDRRQQDHREAVETTRVIELAAKIDRDADELRLANERADQVADRDAAKLQLANDRADQAAYRTRYGGAAAQLGHGNAAIRIAGVYAMAQLADDWGELAAKQQCIDVLCAYLRMPWPPMDAQDTVDAGEVQVRETVVRVITAHLQDENPRSWSGANFDFTGAHFPIGTYDFTNAHFGEGMTAKFDKATFTGAHVTFDGARFAGGRVSFTEAKFTAGEISFDLVVVSAGGEVSFHLATFAGSRIALDSIRLARGTVDFDATTMSGGELRFVLAELTGGKTTFKRADFTGGLVTFDEAHLRGGKTIFDFSHFSGSTIDFPDAEFSGGSMTFDATKFSGGRVTFQRAKFTGGSVTRDGEEFRGWPPLESDTSAAGPFAG